MLVISGVLFLLASILLFTLPGVWILKKARIQIAQLELLTLSTIVGYVAFTVVSYLTTLANVQIFTLPIMLLTAFLSLKKDKLQLPKRLNYVLISVFIIGVIGQLAIISPSGLKINGDIVFWSSNGHDGTWHIALMESIKHGWPINNPIISGERLYNYHFFSDVAPAIFAKYLRFSDWDLYFRFFPLLMSVLLGSSVYFLAKLITKKPTVGVWAVFFTYFAGSFGYLVTFIKNGTIGGESIFWATQIQSASGNPPQLVSDILVIAYLYFVFLLLQKRNTVLFLISSLILGSLALFKIYAAVALCLPTLIIGVWQAKNRNFYILKLGFLGTALASFFYFPNSHSSESFLIFQPWWYIRTMLVEPSRLNWLDIELRRQTYLYEKNYKRVIFLEGVGFLIFLFGNLGMRLVGLWDFIKNLKASLSQPFWAIFSLAIIISFVFPLLFLQKGVASNTSQSLQYFVLLFGILAAVSMDRLMQKIKPNKVRYFFVLIVIFLTIPTQVGLIYEFYSHGAYAKITSEEQIALTYLKNHSGGTAVILTAPYDQNLNLGDRIPNIWDWSDTSYVAALTGRPTFLDDTEQVDIMGYDFKDRLLAKQEVFTNTDPKIVAENLAKTKASFVYFPTALSPRLDLSSVGLKKVYTSQFAQIWAVSSTSQPDALVNQGRY